MTGRPRFVIQKHDATTLHYDLRLEVGGVLKSWVLPKGPSVNPKTKRLAMPTEDHPLEYADFEGVIPEGEYGAGIVMVWDTGTYENIRAEKDGTDMATSITEGKVEVRIDGEKMKGGWVFIRTGAGDKARWLVIKMDDEYADRATELVDAAPDSVLTRRSIEEIAQAE
ncbi:DNA ligase D-like protein (predicted 3'-phosphoesterase) [Methanocalculus alkaliphilus]|uniref:DNA polymerase ligase N-terminal domain-containing protein n=1 Tax=Methanocalculus alkaliphilus TaxID=768730 RepID=UPI0020A0A947|nr:DNA polymerase ligase N-terminal domain-containing protein [Methanocalculus alkaliphilus]MCP1715285.1 DNA ligase D-like protein (predicted 3'-phosphoesterase) [Methanocalculus alkaliphilus]